MERRNLTIIILTLLIVIVGAISVYFFIFTKTCGSEECFMQSLRACDRVSYTVNNEGNVWQYSVQNSLSFSQDECTVKVKYLQIASENPLAKQVKGKSMTCKIPREFSGAYVQIESKLEYCSGPLKESLQDLLIDQLYKYIVQKIGEITEELKK